MKYVVAALAITGWVLSANGAYGSDFKTFEETIETRKVETLCGVNKREGKDLIFHQHKCGSNIQELLEDPSIAKYFGQELLEDPSIISQQRCSNFVQPGKVIMTSPPIYNCQDLKDKLDSEKSRLKDLIREILLELREEGIKF